MVTVVCLMEAEPTLDFAEVWVSGEAGDAGAAEDVLGIGIR